MLDRGRTFVAPAYLLMCLLLGGSAQGVWANMVLQLMGIALIAWAAWEWTESPLPRPAKQLLILAACGIAVVLLQLIPLPPGIWTKLGLRSHIGEGFHALGMAVPPEPLSLTPAATLDSLLGIIPPLALVCAILRLQAYRPVWLAIALIAGTVLGIALGALQVAGSNGMELSTWYLYPETNGGKGVGFFANANHMATLLAITIPFLAAIVASARTASTQRYSAILIVAAGLAILILVGLALNGSLAGYGLALPVLAATLLIILPQASRLRVAILGLTALLVISAVVGMESTAIGGAKIGAEATSSVESRAQLLRTTAHAAADFMPFGSGLGSFPRVYPLYENPQQVTDTYVVHAHNDYIEFVLELGIAAIALVVFFFAWWVAAVWRAWRTAEASPFARAATIASGAILVHSLVDFPLRTAAIATCFGMCLALLAGSRAAPLKERTELRRKRHVEFR